VPGLVSVGCFKHRDGLRRAKPWAIKSVFPPHQVKYFLYDHQILYVGFSLVSKLLGDPRSRLHESANMPAHLRKLGKDGPNIAALGFGLMGMSIAYGTIPSDEERFAVLDRALELGATFWDTSESVT
jgi:hypothetical protein